MVLEILFLVKFQKQNVIKLYKFNDFHQTGMLSDYYKCI